MLRSLTTLTQEQIEERVRQQITTIKDKLRESMNMTSADFNWKDIKSFNVTQLTAIENSQPKKSNDSPAVKTATPTTTISTTFLLFIFQLFFLPDLI